MGEYVGPKRIDTFLSYCVARFHREQEEKVFRIYVTDSLQIMNQGSHLKDRYIDLLKPPDDFDPEEIVAEVVAKAGLVIM